MDWQKVEGGPNFKGLLRRRQMQLDDLAYFEALQNVDAYGGALGKRSGSQFVNGWATYLTFPANVGDTFLSVADGTGFIDGQQVYISTTHGPAVSHGFDYVQFPGALTHPFPIGTPVVQAFPAPGEIQTLFQGVYRNGDKYLYAAVNSAPYKVVAGATPTAMTLQLPTQNAIQITAATTTSGTLGSVQGLAVKDWITIGSAGSAFWGGATPYAVQVQTVTNPAGSVSGTITWSPALPGVPANGTPVNFTTPHSGDAIPPPEMVQYGNYTFFTAGFQTDGAGHGWPTTPLVLRQTTPLVPGSPIVGNRCGLKPPQCSATSITAGILVVGKPGLVAGDVYSYRTRFYNSLTGQESEGGPPISVTPSAAPNNSIQLVLPGSPDPQVDQLRLYRTSANGDGAWYRVLQVGVTTITNFQTVIPDPMPGSTIITVYDYSSDEQLGSQMRDLMDWTIPETVSLLAIWGQANRLIGIDRVQNAVVFSDQPDLATGRLKGESWPTNNSIFVSYDDGDALTGIAAFFDSVLIFKEHSVWRVTGTPPDITIQPIHFRQDQTATGVKTQRLIMMDHDEVVYRGADAIYELNRFQGQSDGFKSQRLSLPIDEMVQATFDNENEEPTGHGVYYRYKRQVRIWETTQRALVLQFESSAEGEPFGWMTWLSAVPDVPPLATGITGPRCSCIARYDPAVFRGFVAPYLPGSQLDAANFIAIDGGMVAQLDIGQADYGCSSYEVLIAPLRFAPGGRGTAARGRAIDWQVQQINRGQASIEILTDWFDTAGFVDADRIQIPLPLIDGLTTMDPSQVDLIGVPLPAFDTLATLIIAPGHHHEFLWREQDLASYYRIMGWTYWFQTLSTQAVWRQNKQTTPAGIITLPNP